MLLNTNLSLLRSFSKKLISKLEFHYNFNSGLIDQIIIINNLKFFWFLMIILKKSLLFNFNQLNDITCVDNLNALKETTDLIKNRFTLIYIFTNTKHASRLIVKVNIDKNQQLPSLTNLFIGSNWLEREIYDMFGIIFQNHPDLRRILTDYGFSYNPLLKDFPLSGFLELKYSEILKCVEYQPIKLMQEYRFFNFESPWNQYNNKQLFTLE